MFTLSEDCIITGVCFLVTNSHYSSFFSVDCFSLLRALLLTNLILLFQQDVDLDYVAKVTHGFSGADLTEICQRVRLSFI